MKKGFYGSALLFAVMMTILLAASPVFAAEVQFKKYTDKKFGFSIEYPDIYAEYNTYVSSDEVSNFEGSADNGKYALFIEGMKKPKGATGESLYNEMTDMEEDEYGYVYGVEPLPESSDYSDDFYRLDYADDSPGPGHTSRVYCVVGKNVVVKYSIRYPNDEWEKYDDITARMIESIKLK